MSSLAISQTGCGKYFWLASSTCRFSYTTRWVTLVQDIETIAKSDETLLAELAQGTCEVIMRLVLTAWYENASYFAEMDITVQALYRSHAVFDNSSNLSLCELVKVATEMIRMKMFIADMDCIACSNVAWVLLMYRAYGALFVICKP